MGWAVERKPIAHLARKSNFYAPLCGRHDNRRDVHRDGCQGCDGASRVGGHSRQITS